MKTRVNIIHKQRGFTLIEMVGVLAIIAILAALLLPRIMTAIREARLNAAVTAINTAKTAAIAYFGKYGRFGDLKGAQLTSGMNDWDRILWREGFLDKPLEVSLGTSASVQLVLASEGKGGAGGTSANGYDLNGDGAADTSGDVVEVVIHGLTAEDAIDLNNRFDAVVLAGGTELDRMITAESNNKGKVEIEEETNGDDPTGTYTAYIYLTSTSLVASEASSGSGGGDGGGSGN